MRHLESTLEKCLCSRTLIYPSFEMYFSPVVIACLGYLCSVGFARYLSRCDTHPIVSCISGRHL